VKKLFSMAAVVAMTCSAVACSSHKNQTARNDQDMNTPVARTDMGTQVVTPPPAGASSAGRAR
jgi:hypothetical protein